MKSLISHLGTQEFPRVRVGIGSTQQADERDQAVVAHVLGKFAPDEKPVVKEAIQLAVDAIETVVRKGTEPAMSAYNGRTVLSS